MGKGVKTSTATTVEEANAADKPTTKAPIINTAGGVASQSGGRASDGIYTTGGAASRATTGAGQGSRSASKLKESVPNRLLRFLSQMSKL